MRYVLINYVIYMAQVLSKGKKYPLCNILTKKTIL